jgi:hypothetical protein
MLIFLSAAASILISGPDPRSMFHEEMPPVGGSIHADYVCAGRDTGIRTTYSLALDDQQVRLTAYSGAGGDARPEDIAQMNAWLEPMASIEDHIFRCRRGAEWLILTGPRRDGQGEVSLSVLWYDGEMLLRRYQDGSD